MVVFRALSTKASGVNHGFPLSTTINYIIFPSYNHQLYYNHMRITGKIQLLNHSPLTMLRNLEYFMAVCEWAALSWRDLAVSWHRMKVFLASSSLFLRRSTPAACIHASRLPGARSWTLLRISRARSLSPGASQSYSLLFLLLSFTCCYLSQYQIPLGNG